MYKRFDHQDRKQRSFSNAILWSHKGPLPTLAKYVQYNPSTIAYDGVSL